MSEHSSYQMPFMRAELGMRRMYTLTSRQDRAQAATIRLSRPGAQGGHTAFPAKFLAPALKVSFASALKAAGSKASSRDEAHQETFSGPQQDGFATLAPGLQRWCSLRMHSGTPVSATTAPKSYPLHDVEEWVEDEADEQQQVMHAAADEQQQAPEAAADAQQDASGQQQQQQQNMADQQPPRGKMPAHLLPARIVASRRQMLPRRSMRVNKGSGMRTELVFMLALQMATMMGGAYLVRAWATMPCCSDEDTSSCFGSMLHSGSSADDETSSCDDSASELHTGECSGAFSFSTGMDASAHLPLWWSTA